MIHLNGNKLCAVDCETSGLNPDEHELLQICVLPLDSDFKPDPKVTPFYMEMQPMYPKKIQKRALAVNGLDLNHLMTNCVPGHRVADLFVDWFDGLGLAPNKGIVPLGQNYQFDMRFIRAWLGNLTYEMCFKDQGHRDTKCVINFINDRAYQKGLPIPFPKTGLSAVATRLGINTDGAHDAMADCIMTAKVYKKLMGQIPTL